MDEEKLCLTQEDLDTIVSLLGDVPFKHAKPIWDFLAIKINEYKMSKVKENSSVNLGDIIDE